jgi:hypothetical protein
LVESGIGELRENQWLGKKLIRELGKSVKGRKIKIEKLELATDGHRRAQTTANRLDRLIQAMECHALCA